MDTGLSTKQNASFSSWPEPLNRRDKEKVVAIDYERLGWLRTLTSSSCDEQERQKAHEEYMSHYREVFRQKPRQPSCSSTGPSSGRYSSLPSIKSNSDSAEESRPDIAHYLASIHNRVNADPYAMKKIERLRVIKRLLQKLPLERTPSDNGVLYKHMARLECLTSQASGPVLEKLSAVALLETMGGAGFTVYGNHGFYLLLQGTAAPLLESAFLKVQHMGSGMMPFAESGPRVLGPGDCFGTLKNGSGHKSNSKHLAVITKEPCSFLRIASRDYARVVEQLKVRHYEDKLGLLHLCQLDSLWPKLSVDKAAHLLVWKKFMANEVVCVEGNMAPFIGFIQVGECRILRQVSVLATGSTEKTGGGTRNVEVGRLSAGEYFGHTSLLRDRPMNSGVVAMSALRLGVILPSDAAKLDEVAQTLLLQSPVTRKAELAKEEVDKTYVKQELKKEWDTFKKSVVTDVISTRGIIPGFGKWQHES